MQRESRIVALVVSCVLFMQSVDTTILGTALASIAADYGDLARL